MSDTATGCNKTETDFLLSLSDSALSRLLSEYPKSQAAAILEELAAAEGERKSEADKVERAGQDDREGARERARARRRATQDIGPLPPPPSGKAKLARWWSSDSLLAHLMFFYPVAFALWWSFDHLRLIADIEAAVHRGSLKAVAMPRGSGKTSILIRAAAWGLLHGAARYVVVIAGTETIAGRLLESIKTELLHNERLHDSFPLELYTLVRLEGESRMASGQKFDGSPTLVQLRQDRIVFGTLPGSVTSGSVLASCGLTGNIRGQQYTRLDGEVLRVDVALFDDPQTRESAASPEQCGKRHSIMTGDALGMAGPGKHIAGLCACTIIERDDLASRLLDPQQSPEWRGQLCKLVDRWPDNPELWERYTYLRTEELKAGGDGSGATAFYAEHRAAMDAGAKVAWPQRYGSGELSALQAAFNLKARDPLTFASEYQNEPLGDSSTAVFALDAAEISKRSIKLPRYSVPSGTQAITAFVDVQKNLLFYCVVAWTARGRGCVIDYGSFPETGRSYYTKADAGELLQAAASSDELAAYLHAGLTKLAELLLLRDYLAEDGSRQQIARLGVDMGWGQSTEIVRRWCRESPHRSRLLPAFGRYIGANSKPWHRWSHSQREQLGLHCRVQPPPPRTPGVQELLTDTNWWKSTVAEKLLIPAGSERSIVLFDAEPQLHRMFGDHCCAEDPQLVLGKTGVQMIEWKSNAGRPNNDLWDCLVGAAVVASLCGVDMHAAPDAKSKPPGSRRKPPSAGRAQLLGKAR